MDADILDKIHEDLDFIKKKVALIDNEIADISSDLHRVRSAYMKKLEKIKKGRFHRFATEKEFLSFLENEI